MAIYNFRRAANRSNLLKEGEYYLRSGDWEQKRQHVLFRDNYTCKHCGKQDGAMFVHHKDNYNYKTAQLNELVTLCWDCHTKFHSISYLPKRKINIDN